MLKHASLPNPRFELNFIPGVYWVVVGSHANVQLER